MVSIGNMNIWLLLIIIVQVSAIPYNRPKFYSNATWNTNGITVANSSTVGLQPFDIFINANNTIYVANREKGQILQWEKENITVTRNISGLNLPRSLFVTDSDVIYADNSVSYGEVDKWIFNSSMAIPVMYTCSSCYDIFIDVSNTLYCSMDASHQVVAKSLDDPSNKFKIVAGRGMSGSSLNMLYYPNGIFVDINFDLYVADSYNHRIQLFRQDAINGITVVGNGSVNITITLYYPSGVVLDADGYLFIVDFGNNRIVGSNANGFRCLVGCSGNGGSASHQLNSPRALSFDSDGNMYITDSGNNRIQMFLLITNMSVWTITASMNPIRGYDTASVLINGTVLVAGGHNGSVVLNTATLYKPSTGTWSTTGNLNIQRNKFAASVLQNGKVLISGGNYNWYRSEAELYDPSTGVWTNTSNMNIGRELHTSSLLTNGSVLITGGYANTVALNSAELYSPLTATWTTTGNMSRARHFHTASVLFDGKVLVTGGKDGNYLTEAELYDPVTGNWTTTSNMSTPRCSHTATVLSNGTVLVTGGFNNGGPVITTELYDAITETWTSAGNLNFARQSHTASLLTNGYVLVTGGSNGTTLNSAELYNPSTGIWITTTNMHFSRTGHHASILLNGTILVSGGYVSASELYTYL